MRFSVLLDAKNYFPHNLSAFMLYHQCPNLIFSSTIVVKYWLSKPFWSIGVGHVAQFWIVRYKQKLSGECLTQVLFIYLFIFSNQEKRHVWLVLLIFPLLPSTPMCCNIMPKDKGMVNRYLMLLETSQLFPKGTDYTISYPTNNIWEIQLLTILTNTWHFQYFQKFLF